MHAAWSVLSLWAVQNGDFRVSNAPAASLDDDVAPIIEASVEGDRGHAGTYLLGAELIVEATDDDAGIDTVEYRSHRRDWQEYDGPLILEPGVWDFEVRATDTNGNTATYSVPRVRVLRISELPARDHD